MPNSSKLVPSRFDKFQKDTYNLNWPKNTNSSILELSGVYSLFVEIFYDL